MRTALIPGSFDPFHNGHLEVVETASRLFDGVIVAAIRNPQKTKQLFDLDQRREMIAESVAHLDNVKIEFFASLVVDVAKQLGTPYYGWASFQALHEMILAEEPDFLD